MIRVKIIIVGFYGFVCFGKIAPCLAQQIFIYNCGDN
jgi:hypothetical protein